MFPFRISKADTFASLLIRLECDDDVGDDDDNNDDDEDDDGANVEIGNDSFQMECECEIYIEFYKIAIRYFDMLMYIMYDLRRNEYEIELLHICCVKAMKKE